MDKIREMIKGEIEASVELPNVVISFKLAENCFIRASITEAGELYLNANWGTIFIRPDSANTCFVSALPPETHLTSQCIRLEGGEDGSES